MGMERGKKVGGDRAGEVPTPHGQPRDKPPPLQKLWDATGYSTGQDQRGPTTRILETAEFQEIEEEDG